MLPPDEALARALARAPAPRAERVRLAEAFHRIAAETVRCERPVPAHDDSAMDGYAVRASDAAPGAKLRLLPVIPAGRVATAPVGPGEAAPIMTGAPLPPGADAVVILEDTDRATAGEVELRVAAKVGENVRKAGHDLAVGDALVEVGDRLGPARLGLLASIGRVDVAVGARPRVSLLATGDELVPPGRPLQPGQIHASVGVVLAGYTLDAGGVPVDLGIAPDDLDALCARMEAGLEGDVLVTTGGVSAGRYDLVRDAFVRLGIRMDFWKIRIKPGKPLAFGQVERGGRTVTVFGLPGNPVSGAVTFLEFVRPFLRVFQGDRRPHLPVVDAVALDSIRESPGRDKLLRVRVELGPDGFVCRSAGSQSSGALRGMARANGLLHRGADQGGVDAGDRVRVQLVDPGDLCGPSHDLW